MPWIPRPFDYYGTSPNQILEDLTQANDNFEILGKCFVNDDPTTGKVKVAETLNGFCVSDTSMPNAIPVAGPDGKIASEWLNLDSIGNFTASTTPSANQIPVLDNNANLILPNTSLIQTNTYTIRRVDLTNTTSDYLLAVGEEAIINFTDATSVPLHIATQDGTMYEIISFVFNSIGKNSGVPGDISLNPNNTTYSSAFEYTEIGTNLNGSIVNYDTFSYFKIGFALSSFYGIITNKITCKAIKVFCHIYGTDADVATTANIVSAWQDTTTAWTSLGTITFPQTTSGQILIRRLV
jgi:hypothetical protein